MIIPIPEGIQMLDRDGVLSLTRRWFNIGHIITLFFSLIWNSFLVFWYSMLPSLFIEDGGFQSAVLIFYLFPLIHVGVGVGLFYYSLCGLLNKTEIRIMRDKLVVRHFPLPWLGNREIPSNEIKQLYTQEKINQSKNGRTITYEVNAILKSNRKLKFVSGLAQKDEGIFIEKTIEDRLYIRDEKVAGEVEK